MQHKKCNNPLRFAFAAAAKEPFLSLNDLLAMDLIIYNLNYS